MDGLEITFLIAIGLVAVAILVLGIWGFFLQMSVFFRYNANNHRKAGDKTAREVAEDMLHKLGYDDVRVRKTSYFWLLIFYKWGNRYSPRRNSIFLYRNIINKKSVTAVAIATQKVGLVMQHRNGEKKMKFRAKWELWTRLAPNMFLPIISVGLALDFVVNGMDYTTGTFGFITLAFVILALAYTIFAMVALYLVIPTERRAGVLAFDVIKKYNLIPAEHHDRVLGLYRVQVNVYIADFILAILNLALDILQVAARASKNAKHFKRR
jgi:Zn-dependent membrane protease YugP